MAASSVSAGYEGYGAGHAWVDDVGAGDWRSHGEVWAASVHRLADEFVGLCGERAAICRTTVVGWGADLGGLVDCAVRESALCNFQCADARAHDVSALALAFGGRVSDSRCDVRDVGASSWWQGACIP